MKNQKIAIVYDKLNTPYGGAEVVLLALQKIFPKADLFSTVFDQKRASWAQQFNIKTSFLQFFSKITTNHKLLLPLTPIAFESLNLDEYDLIISVTSGEAKGVLTKPNQTHICYILTPPRYLHTHTQTYLGQYPVLKYPIIRNLVNIFFQYLKRWDIVASTRPDHYIAISKLIQHRVKNIYDRSSAGVVYPPVSLTPTKKEMGQLPIFSNQIPNYYLSISRLVRYKRVDLSIKAALKLNHSLVVVGSGEELASLQKIAKNSHCTRHPNESLISLLQRAKGQNKTIIFTGTINEKEKQTLYKNCEAVLMPGEEDFGITGLEAGIFGKPVIVFYTSGVSEILKDGLHAVHIKSETVQELTYALGKLDALSLNKDVIRENALKYNYEHFAQSLKETIENILKG